MKAMCNIHSLTRKKKLEFDLKSRLLKM